MDMQKILVLNAKGGCGKTTIATNLAACYASRGHYPAMVDNDAQGSTLNWLGQRSADYPPIHGVEAYKHNTSVTRSWQMRMPKEVDRIIIDSPCGVTGSKLVEYIRQANTIIIPVLPSPIDVYTVTSFIKEIIMLGKMRNVVAANEPRSGATRLGVVANRVKENTRVYSMLESFLAELNLPFVTALSDSHYYAHAYVEGVGIHELHDPRTQFLRQQWQPLMKWLDNKDDTGRLTTSRSTTIESLSAK